MKVASMMLFVSLIFPIKALAQTDLCWRDSYLRIPAQWASYGYVVEASNRFQTIGGATIELRSTHLPYEEARNKTVRSEEVPTSLVKTVVSDAKGKFDFGTLPSGEYEIRAVMAGREMAIAHVETATPPQWKGRGLRVALSHQSKGCSRIYQAGLDDTDCGRLDCERLPAGRMRVIQADGMPLGRRRLLFYRHSKMKAKSPELTLTTGAGGAVSTSEAHGCYDILIERSRQMHLCFSPVPATESVTVTLSPGS